MSSEDYKVIPDVQFFIRNFQGQILISWDCPWELGTMGIDSTLVEKTHGLTYK